MMSIDPQTVPGDVFEMLEMTSKTAEEVFSLLDNLLKWTKSQLGKLSNVPQPIDMVGLVDGVIEVFKPIAESKSISLEFEFRSRVYQCYRRHRDDKIRRA